MMQEQWLGDSCHSTLYKEQCDAWYKRETRSGVGKECKDDENDSSRHDTGLPVSLTQVSETSQTSCLTTSQVAAKGKDEFESCAGCDPSRNEMIKSQGYIKILANNISICNRHRVICEALLDMQKCNSNNLPPYPPEALLNDSGPRFSVNEDRRLRKAVRQLGENAWHDIVLMGDFAFGRTADDLIERWYKLCELNYDEL